MIYSTSTVIAAAVVALQTVHTLAAPTGIGSGLVQARGYANELEARRYAGELEARNIVLDVRDKDEEKKKKKKKKKKSDAATSLSLNPTPPGSESVNRRDFDEFELETRDSNDEFEELAARVLHELKDLD
ncbi:hypothetical protein C8J56DRAFT_888119 [Mycena floridula]|nr:hypothetical protein C8J56DRAFT_888119 [Mycena floridula]